MKYPDMDMGINEGERTAFEDHKAILTRRKSYVNDSAGEGQFTLEFLVGSESRKNAANAGRFPALQHLTEPCRTPPDTWL